MADGHIRGNSWCWNRIALVVMARKQEKTLRSQYEAILADKGLTLKDCEILSFEFPDASKRYLFHYELMEGKFDYLLCDCLGTYAKVVVVKSSPDIERIVECAAMYEGKRILINAI